MNLFHGGRLATMPPKLVNEEGDLFVYRPLAHVAEADCERFATAMNYPIIPCDLCGSPKLFDFAGLTLETKETAVAAPVLSRK